MKILIFGTGDYYERYKKWLVQEELLALIDNSQQKQGSMESKYYHRRMQ